MTLSSRTSLAAAGATLAAGALLLAGCAAQPAPSPSPTATQSQEPTPTTAPGSAADGFTCDDLTGPLNIAQYDMQPTASFTPDAGSYAAKIVSLGGIACQWENSATSKTITVALGKFSDPALETQVATGGTLTSTGSGPRTYAMNSGGTATGDLETFYDSGFWVSAVSPLFTDPAVGTTFLEGVGGALPSG